MSTSSLCSVSSSGSSSYHNQKSVSVRNSNLVQLTLKKNKGNKDENLNCNQEKKLDAKNQTEKVKECEEAVNVKEDKKKTGPKSPKKRQHISVADFGISKFGNFNKPQHPPTTPTKMNNNYAQSPLKYEPHSPNTPGRRYSPGSNQNSNGPHTYPLEFLHTVGIQMSNVCGPQVVGPTYQTIINRSPTDPNKLQGAQNAPNLTQNMNNNNNGWHTNNYNPMYQSHHQNYSSYHHYQQQTGGDNNYHHHNGHNINNNYQTYNRNTGNSNNNNNHYGYQHNRNNRNGHWGGQNKNHGNRNKQYNNNHSNSENMNSGASKRNHGNLYYVKATENAHFVGTPHVTIHSGCFTPNTGYNKTSPNHVPDISLLDVEIINSSSPPPSSVTSASQNSNGYDSDSAQSVYSQLNDKSSEASKTEPAVVTELNETKTKENGSVSEKVEEPKVIQTGKAKKKKKLKQKNSAQMAQNKSSDNSTTTSDCHKSNSSNSSRSNNGSQQSINQVGSWKSGSITFGSSTSLDQVNRTESTESVEICLYSTTLDNKGKKKL